MSNSKMINVGGLWKNEMKDGTPYLSGSLGPRVKILVFQNSRKQKDTDPDYTICLAPNEAKQKRQGDEGDAPF